jgi:HlyD family secretion protein
VATIKATGTVEPEEVVDVGAQVAGLISAFGKDKHGKTIDYCSEVEAGTVLVKIDEALYLADLASAEAGLQQAKANRVSADANVLQMQARLVEAEQDWKRAQKLGPSEALAPTTYDQYRATYEVAKANVEVAAAAVEQAKANTAAAQATLDRAKQNLGYCTITSPVKGVIIDRRVNIGQTVVSSLSAPSLFLLAKDLTRIQVWVSVNEADIGSIHSGMPATFTVDAYPDKVFHGRVGKIRLNATMTQNVVTYTVEVLTDNADGKLLPYLTANAQFITATRENVLTVPNAALRWRPRPEQIAAEFRRPARGPDASKSSKSSKGRRSQLFGGGLEGAAQAEGMIWTQQGAFVRPVRVTTGLTDGTQTEVQSGDLTEGLAIVIGERSPQALAGGPPAGPSPFTPQLGRSRASAAPAAAGGGGPPGGGR